MRERFLTVVILAIVLVGFGMAAESAHRDAVRGSQDVTVVEQEPFQPTAGQVRQLNNSDDDLVFNESDSVTVDQNGTVIESQGNWTWYESNGTLKINQSTAMNTSESANVSYGYYEPSNEQQLTKELSLFFVDTVGATLVEVLGALFLLFAVVVMLSIAR